MFNYTRLPNKVTLRQIDYPIKDDECFTLLWTLCMINFNFDSTILTRGSFYDNWTRYPCSTLFKFDVIATAYTYNSEITYANCPDKLGISGAPGVIL